MKNSGTTILVRAATAVWVFLCLLILDAPAGWCAVTDVSVATGHTLSNVRHVLKHGKVFATNHSVSAECVNAPPGGNAAQVQANNISPVPGVKGTYKFNIHVNEGAVEGTYKLRFYDHSTLQKSSREPRSLSPDLSVKVSKIAVVAVSFLAGDGKPIVLITDKDNDEPTTSFEWIDGSKNQPGAFIRSDGTPKHIKVRLHGPENRHYNISAGGTWGGANMKTVLFDGSGVAEETFEIGSFPDWVTKEDAGWQWKYQRQEDSGNLNSTKHKIYVTLKNPTAGKNYEKLYGFTCGWAHGEKTEEGAWTAIWGAIASKSATGYSYWTLPCDPEEFIGRLPRPGYMPLTQKALIPTKALIWYGMGRCGNWQNFAINLLALQGVSATAVDINLVRPHQFLKTDSSAQGSGSGQPAETQFGDHAIIRYGNLWDPSYGEGSFSNLLNYEDKMISQYRDQLTFPGDASDWQDNVKGVLEVR